MTLTCHTGATTSNQVQLKNTPHEIGLADNRNFSCEYVYVIQGYYFIHSTLDNVIRPVASIGLILLSEACGPLYH